MFTFTFGAPPSSLTEPTDGQDAGLFTPVGFGIRSYASTFINTAGAADTRSTITVDKPPQTMDGDFMVMLVQYDPLVDRDQVELPSIQTPSGWTKEREDFFDTGGSTYGYTFALFTKYSLADPTNFAVDFQAVDEARIRVMIVSFQDPNPTTALGDNQVILGNEDSSLSIPTLTVTNGDIVLLFGASFGNTLGQSSEMISFSEGSTSIVNAQATINPPYALGERAISSTGTFDTDALFSEANEDTFAVAVAIQA